MSVRHTAAISDLLGIYDWFKHSFTVYMVIIYLLGQSKISHSAVVLMDFRVTSRPWYVH